MSRATAIDAYWNFFASFNTRDAYQFSTALHYPHVRLTWRNEPVILADIEAHALRTSWDRLIEVGWDHTVGAQPEGIHQSTDKWHIKGGWTRVTKAEDPILVNRVTYIVTQLEGQWGIQCRYGIDPAANASGATPYDERYLEIAQAWTDAINRQNSEMHASYLADTVYEIGVGSVTKHAIPPLPEPDLLLESAFSIVQSSNHAATISITSSSRSVLLYLVNGEAPKIKAISWI